MTAVIPDLDLDTFNDMMGPRAHYLCWASIENYNYARWKGEGEPKIYSICDFTKEWSACPPTAAYCDKCVEAKVTNMCGHCGKKCWND